MDQKTFLSIFYLSGDSGRIEGDSIYPSGDSGRIETRKLYLHDILLSSYSFSDDNTVI